ncbi:Molybdate transporter 1 [Madurella mycetomatis]|uniref:Molybdate transporter 1 n=1 Tax=Madurella mycetomatis TaxID=100816 RepID=A0A175WFX2_9PEZI|nr:Molybdate transporter 1 [Madurella mycetomatis]KXX81814.1 Molybdate transporter 1 [Madurella mycetomatis]
MRSSFLAELGRRNRHSLRTLRDSPAAEISGALGDLGTLLPLMIALALQGSIDLASTLVFSGLFNIVTGLLFGIPLPVQPMKAIASSALTSHTPLPVVTASGALVSLAVLFLSLTGLIRLLTRLIPSEIIRGIQLGAGLRLVISAGTTLILPLPWLPPPALDNRLLTSLLFLLLFLTQRPPRGRGAPIPIPFALLLFLLGLSASAFSASPEPPSLSPYRPSLRKPDFASPLALSASLAQLPLTTLNSVLAASALAADLLPALPVSPTQLGVSVGLMNLASCAFGAMPVCHGAGGLAAQHRFGARSGASVVLLGAAKLLVGLLFGDTVVGVLRAFPKGVLGVMVLAAGLELARAGSGPRAGEDVGGRERQEGWTVMMVTAGGILAFKNDAVGFLAGLGCHLSYRAAGWLEGRWGEARGGRRLESEERTALLR